MTEGYLYCFSNESMPGIHKVGYTYRTPKKRLIEANSSNTWKPPTPYKIEFAKKVLDSKSKEIGIHKILSQYTERINPNREFFRVSPEEVIALFDLIDGELWVENEEEKEDEEEEENEEEENEEEKNDEEKKEIQTKNKKSVIKCRDASKCFTHGQRIRHIIGINKTWIGIYDSSKKAIVCNEKIYKGRRSPLNQFAKSHYEIERNYRVPNVNAWAECECEVDGKWISTDNLQHLIVLWNV